MPQKTIKTGVLQRSFEIRAADIDQDARTVALAFSSEEPVDRWFGKEILDHGSKSIRLGRLKKGGPLLMDHDTRDHVGAVGAVSVDSDRVARAVVRFGKGVRASEVFQDVIDGIRTCVSLSYAVHKMVLESEDDKNGPTYRATDWEPYEISLVSVPADITVGVGRSAEGEQITTTIDATEEPTMPTENTETTRAAPAPAVAAPDITAQVTAAQAGARSAELTRIREIQQIGEHFGKQDMARQFVDSGKSVDDFRSELVTELGKKKVPSPDIGITEQQAESYSFVRALNALANPQSRQAQEVAKFETECSQAAAKRLGREARGLIVPVDVLRRSVRSGMQQRDLNITTATAGGHLVATDLLAASFIEMLRNAMKVEQMGATMLRDLVGNIAIPRQTSGTTAYWVAESAAVTESQAAFDQVTMTPKTVGAFTDYSRKLLLQSSVDVEAFVRADLAKTIALELDRAAINGSAAGAEPRGILNTVGIGSVVGGANGLAPTWAHIVGLETEVAIDNADVGNLSYFTNAKVRGKLKQVEKAAGTAQFIWSEKGSEMNGYPAVVSNQVPSNLVKGASGAVCSAIIFGNWADLLIGMWGGLDLLVDPYTGSTTGVVRVVAMQDVDIAVRHPESFAAMVDALTT